MNNRNLLLKFIFVWVIQLSATALMAQNPGNSIPEKMNDWQNLQELAHASFGFAVCDVQTGEQIFKSEPQLSLVPASILKVVTTATALEVFGPDFRFQTALLYSGTIRHDTLFGDLQIKGGGDPTLGSKYFPASGNFLDDWKGVLARKGIKIISGNLNLDAGIYEKYSIPNTWIWEDVGNYYGAGASGISYRDNLYEIHLSSGKEEGSATKIERTVPEIPGLDLRNEVLSSNFNADQAYVFGSPMENRRVIRGTIPKNQADFIVKASVPDPAALLAHEFRKKLQANGISISGETVFDVGKTGIWNQLAINQSPPLSEIIRITNHESVNLFAEHLLKHLAFQKTGLGSTNEGCKTIIAFWKDKGLDMNGFFMNDGSGLSRFNCITASQMVGILNYMKIRSNYSDVFYKSLPTTGNGTLTLFSSVKFPNNCLHAKSGSMTRVRCYAGYLTTVTGRQLSFTIMLNNFSCSQSELTGKIEELLLELIKL